MPMPRYYPLRVNHDFNLAHNNSVFKHELRSKAAAVAYFDGLGGAGTIAFTGTEGVDYEFHAYNGFRALSTTGQAKILISNILTDTTQLRYLTTGGMSWEYECLTSQWIEQPYTPATWLVPPPHLAGGTTSGAQDGRILFDIRSSSGGNGCLAIIRNDTSSGDHRLGYNRLEYYATNNAANTSTLTSPVSGDGKGPHFKQRISLVQGCLSGWTNNNPMVAPFAGANTSYHGERRCFPFSSAQTINEHSSGTFYVTLCNNGATNGCSRWIRNIRLFSAPTTMNVHPMLRCPCSFGDSYSQGLLGPIPTDATPTGVSIGTGGYAGFSEEYQNACEIGGPFIFAQRMIEAGYGIGGSYGGGAGGRSFSTSMDSEGWRNQFVTFNHPTLAFTAGMHNDTNPIYNGLMTLAGTSAQTLASFKVAFMAQYILPVMQRGCYGWGFLALPVSKLNDDAGYGPMHTQISDMIMSLPAAWDLAYPQYSGKVKARDLRVIMGPWAATNKYWKGMFIAGEYTHPSIYGSQLFVNTFADMALEWLRE